MASTVTNGSLTQPQELLHQLESIPGREWSRHARSNEIITAIFFTLDTHQRTANPKRPLIRAVVVWSTSDPSLSREQTSLIIGKIYNEAVARILITPPDSLNDHPLSFGSEFINAAILAGKTIFIITKLLPAYLESHPMEDSFLNSALERGDLELIDYLMELNPEWKRFERFPWRTALNLHCDALILKMMERDEDFLYRKIENNLCIIHLAALEKREKLLNCLLIKYLFQNRCHFPYFLFPGDFQNYQYLLERYILLCKRILAEEIKPPTAKLDPVLNSFLSMHLNVCLSGKSIDLESFRLVYMCLLVGIENFYREISGEGNSDITPEEKYLEITRRLDCLCNIQIWLECCEPSGALYRELIDRIKTVKTSLCDIRTSLKIPTRL